MNWRFWKRRTPLPPAVRIDRAGRIGAIAFLLLAAIGFLWARSTVYFDVFSLITGDGHIQAITSDRGVVTVFVSTIPTTIDRAWSFDHDAVRAPWMDETLKEVEKEVEWHAGGRSFAIGRSRPDAFSINGKASFAFARFPHWLPMFLVMLPSLRRWRWGWRAKRRQRRGLCIDCGYDLRSSGEVCPECGTARA